MDFSLRIGAQAGAGVMVTGRMAAKCFTRGGYNVVAYPEYPSLVRGGHNVFHIRISDAPVNAPVQLSAIVIALNRDAVFYHKDFLTKNGVILYDAAIDIADSPQQPGMSRNSQKQFREHDQERIAVLDKRTSLDSSAFVLRKDSTAHPIPLKELIEKAGGEENMRNTVALAAALAVVDYPFEMLESVIADEFSRKGEEVIRKNISAAKAGYEYMKEKIKNSASLSPIKLHKLTDKRKLLVGGNEACALGAVKACMKFYAAYPMTPASGILHYLCEKERQFNIVVKQTEDEIAAINYAIGANFAGVRAATGSSGGGFALMTEAIGLAACSETPVVVFLVQRIGPSTGMPTWTEQADIRFALHASQGDFLRVILAPGDVNECFLLSAKAFTLAEKYQLPVIVLSDKLLAESFFSTDGFEESKVKIERGKITENPPLLKPAERYKRYLLTKDGVSPRVFPGTANGMHVASSYEHDETGFSSESFVMRAAQVDKRSRKINALLSELEAPVLYGPKRAQVTLIVWGSQKLPALDALPLLEKQGIKANVIHFSILFPLDEKKVKKILSGCKKTVLIENSPTAQFGGMLKQYAYVDIDSYLLKYDGRPFFQEQIAEQVAKLAKAKFRAGTGKKEIRVCEKEDLEYYNPQRHGLM